ncbi:MAG: hypothetical protein QXF79_02145 [Ignisphaera sp.]
MKEWRGLRNKLEEIESKIVSDRVLHEILYTLFNYNKYSIEMI